MKEGGETEIFKPATAAFQGPLGELNASEPLYMCGVKGTLAIAGNSKIKGRPSWPLLCFFESCSFEDVLQLFIAHFQKAALYSFLFQLFLLS